MEDKIVGSCTLSCTDRIRSNISPIDCSKKFASGRILLRVKRPRSHSPAEALLLTENVTETKRARIGNF